MLHTNKQHGQQISLARTTLILFSLLKECITIHRYPISVMCKVYTGYHGTSETEHGLCTLIRAFSDFKAFLYILIGGFSLKPPIKIYKKALKSEKARIMCTCTVDFALAKARGLSLRTGAQTMLYLSLLQILVIESRDN